MYHFRMLTKANITNKLNLFSSIKSRVDVVMSPANSGYASHIVPER